MKINIPVVLITVALVCVGFLSEAHAVSPAPDGGYPGGNTAEGQNSLLNLATGTYNTAVGFLSLASNTTTGFNTALGAGALFSNAADENTATGAAALFSNAIGTFNTANGAFALFSNTSFDNTAMGCEALLANTTGSDNTASGFEALFFNTTGSFNVANGEFALGSNTSGSNNTAAGDGALANNTTGSFNTALGPGAGYNATTGSNNVYIGAGVAGVAAESNACYIASIFGQTSASGVPVLINSNNQLGTATSSKRFKDDIKPVGKASESLFSLSPVSFRYKQEIDPSRTSQFGLVAEDVEKVNPALVVRDKYGKPYSVRYDQVNAMLLNEFLKEHRKVEQQGDKIQEQDATIAQLKSGIQALAATVKEQAAQIQKVSAQLDATKPTTQLALSNH